MNHLAHLFLSCGEEEWLVGNFLADFISRRKVEKLSPGIQRGVGLHHSIDAFTDRHPMVRQGVRRLYAGHGKYAPVLVDVFYDHFLAVQWPVFSSEPLPEFARRAYRILEAHLPVFPVLMQDRIPLMIENDWLQQYGHMEGLAFTFERMKSRVSRPEQLLGVMDSLQRDYEALTTEFLAFFPELIEHVKQNCCPT